MKRDLFDRLAPVKNHNDDPVYRRADIDEQADEVIALEGGGLLAVSIVEDLHVSFVVLRFDTSDTDGSNATYERVFHGNGPSGALRELRHTFWGEQNNGGYIFYPNAKLMTDALDKLGRWFDLD